jgi:hypothetical protein
MVHRPLDLDASTDILLLWRDLPANPALENFVSVCG